MMLEVELMFIHLDPYHIEEKADEKKNYKPHLNLEIGKLFAA